jgi:PAS domain S-box-containing protein
MNINATQKAAPLILVVDDDKFMRTQLRRAMEQAGYQVVEASDGEQALAVYTRSHPDIILLDALMPVMDGFTCCSQLQKLPGGDRTPVLMITALEDQESVDQAFEAGATDYITKPIHWAVLRQRVRYLLAASQAEEELRQREEFLRRIIKSSPDCIKVLDLEGRLLYMSAGGQSLLEIDNLSSVMNSQWVDFWQETYNQAARSAVETAKAGGIGKFQGYCPTAKGTPKWWEVVVTPLLDAKGKPEKLLSVSRDITERKQAEEALQETNQRVIKIFEGITDAFFALDKQWQFTYLNRQAEQLLQKMRAELLGKNIWDELPEAVGSKFYQEYHRAVSEQVSVEFEEFYPPLDTWFAVHAYPSPEGLSVYFQDITERKRAQEALQESEARFRRLFESNIIGIIFADLSGNITMANNAFLQIVGYTQEELHAGQVRWNEMTPAEYRHLDEQAIAELQQWGVCNSFEKEYLCKNGSRIPVMVGGALLEGTQNLTICFVLDITERKQAEEELQRQNLRSHLFADVTLKIRQSLQLEEILQTTVTEVQKLLQADRVLVYRVWPDGKGSAVTEAVVPGWPIILGQNFPAEVFPEEYRQLYRQGRNRVIDNVENAEMPSCLVGFLHQWGAKAKLVVPILLKEELWGLLIAHQCSSPRQWSSFEVELLRQLADQIGIALAQSQLLEEETRQRQELARSNAELQQFASIASHDLQEPLRKIQAFGNRLKATYGETLNAQGLDYLERMQNAAQRMQNLIDDLLILSRITTRVQAFVPVNLTQVTQEVLSDLEVRSQQTGGHVEVGELPTIDGDPVQMRQLLQNLISNALKFHQEGEPPVVKIYSQLLDRERKPVEADVVAELCQIIVEDNGIGFDEKYLDRIFNVFQRLHSRSEYEGTGMGLAICRKITERHGGSITAKSTPEHGAKFIVTLPVKQRRGENAE